MAAVKVTTDGSSVKVETENESSAQIVNDWKLLEKMWKGEKKREEREIRIKERGRNKDQQKEKHCRKIFKEER